MKKLYIKQAVFKITDHYPITDEEGNPVYYVDQDFKWVGKKYQVADNQGHLLFELERGINLFLPEYTIKFVTGQTIQIRKQLTFFRNKFDIEIENYALKVEGDFIDRSYALYNNGKELATIVKKWFSWGDAYEITILDEAFMDLSVAVMIAVDELLDKQAAANS